MFVRDLYLELHEVVSVTNDQSVADVYEIIKKSGYRCIPVVDKSGLYKGMIYKVHLMEDIYENGGGGKPDINHLLQHEDLFIQQRSPFLTALVKIKALPFISVVEDGLLVGILTHNKVESVLEDAFAVKTGGINITLSSIEAKGMIEKLTNTLRGENIEGMFTLDSGAIIARRVVITLENGKSEENLDTLKEKLEKNGFRILHVDRLEPVASN